MEIIVKIKNIYGTDLIYPVCDKFKLLLGLTGQKTFSLHQIEKIKKLGYTTKVEEVTI